MLTTEQRPPSPEFSLSEQYFKEPKPETEAKIEGDIRQFDLSYSFSGLPELIKKFGKEKAMYQVVLGVMLNIWTLRQELLGEMDTKELVTLVVKHSNGRLQFKNDLYGQAKNIEQMYDASLAFVPEALRPRYKRENDQAVAVFKMLTHALSKIDFESPDELFEQQLILQGFHQEDIDISPSMLANVASLREQCNSISDLQTFIQTQPTIRAWVGPAHLVTASPPHWSHHSGETGIIWASECIIFPNTREIFIRQNGKFGKTTEEKILPYLSFGQTEALDFETEEELMQFINIVLLSEYHQPKVLLDFMVAKLGGLRPVGKIDRNVRKGHLDIEPYFHAVKKLFEFEYQRLDSDGMNQILMRLGEFSELMIHQIARNQPKALAGLLATYREMVSQNPHASAHEFTKAIHTTAVGLDSGFKLPINLSQLDCVGGGILKISTNIANPGLTVGMTPDMQLLISRAEKKGFKNFEDVKKFCQLYGKDASLFQTQGACAMCGKDTFIWSSADGGCNVCPMCEVKDDMKFKGNLGDFYADGGSGENLGIPRSSSLFSLNLTRFVAGMITPGVYDAGERTYIH